MKRINMFSLALVFLLLLLFSFACKEGTSLVAPDNTSVSSEEPNWISLPVPNDTRLQKTFSVTELITVQNGGTIQIRESYDGGPHGKVKVFAKIKFGKNVVTEDTYFTMTLDDETCMLTFSPSMTFDKDAELTIELKGIDLGGVDKKDVDFVYYDANGQYVSVDYKKLKVNIRKGDLKVEKVKIPHFSRYGFTK